MFCLKTAALGQEKGDGAPEPCIFNRAAAEAIREIRMEPDPVVQKIAPTPMY